MNRLYFYKVYVVVRLDRTPHVRVITETLLQTSDPFQLARRDVGK